MNLDNNPTKEQLADLLRACDDRAGHHVLWVDRGGEAHVTPVSADCSPAEFRQDHPDAQLQFDVFEPGHNYVGPGAADDHFWVEDVFIALLDEWAKAKGSPETPLVGYI